MVYKWDKSSFSVNIPIIMVLLTTIAATLAGFTHGISVMSGWFLPIIYGALGALPSVLILFADLEKTNDQLRSAHNHKYKERTNVYDFIVGKFRSFFCQNISRDFASHIGAIPYLAEITLHLGLSIFWIRAHTEQSSLLQKLARIQKIRGQGVGLFLTCKK